MTTIDAATHYHVLAIHDWGGIQQCIHGWDDQWTNSEARQFADHLILADANCWGHPAVDDRSVFGYLYSDIRSCNVAPGYNAVWRVGCDRISEQCHDELFAGPVCRLGVPYWTCSAPIGYAEGYADATGWLPTATPDELDELFDREVRPAAGRRLGSARTTCCRRSRRTVR